MIIEDIILPIPYNNINTIIVDIKNYKGEGNTNDLHRGDITYLHIGGFESKKSLGFFFIRIYENNKFNIEISDVIHISIMNYLIKNEYLSLIQYSNNWYEGQLENKLLLQLL